MDAEDGKGIRASAEEVVYHIIAGGMAMTHLSILSGLIPTIACTFLGKMLIC